MMGSSSTALLLFVDETNDNLTVANCGDTRAILCRAGRALQLTRDQKSGASLFPTSVDLSDQGESSTTNRFKFGFGGIRSTPNNSPP